MKRLPFEHGNNHYDETISSVDEKICKLIKERRDMSDNNPGFPPAVYIEKWAKKYGLYEDLLTAIFETLHNDEHFRPQVVPKGFQKYIPVLKSVAKDECLYSVTFIRQYENASVVNFNIDWNESNDFSEEAIHRHGFWELHINDEYYCTMNNGGGTGDHFNHNYVVSPRLPDDLSGLQLMFRENEAPFKKSQPGVEIVINLSDLG